jgi:hypothetical protein
VSQGTSTAGDDTAERLGEWKTESIPEERRMECRVASSEGDGRYVVEDLSYREILEIWAADRDGVSDSGGFGC